MGISGANPIRTVDIYSESITSKFQSNRKLVMQKEVTEFLESVGSHNTRKSYVRGLALFEEFSGRSIGETLLTRKKDKKKNLEREVERFYNWVIEEKKLNPNTSYNAVVSLKSLMTFYDMPLKLKRGSCARIPTMPRDWIPSVKELRLMFSIGDLREKLILSMAKDIPLRINDFLSIKKSDASRITLSQGGESVASGDSTESVPSFMLRTQKTKTPMQCFLSTESIDLLKIYLTGASRTNLFLFEGKNGKRLNEDSVNLLLKNLVKKAGITTESVVRFHMFRKVFCSVAASMGMNTDIIKMLTGKRVKADMSPYYEGVNLYEQWKKINEHLRLTQTNGNGKVANLEKENEELRSVMKVIARFVAEEMRKTRLAQKPSKESLKELMKRTKEDLEVLDNFVKEEEE
jgi:integrase